MHTYDLVHVGKDLANLDMLAEKYGLQTRKFAYGYICT